MGLDGHRIGSGSVHDASHSELFAHIEAGIILCASGSHKLPLLSLSLCDKTVGVCPVALTGKTLLVLQAIGIESAVYCSLF